MHYVLGWNFPCGYLYNVSKQVNISANIYHLHNTHPHPTTIILFHNILLLLTLGCKVRATVCIKRSLLTTNICKYLYRHGNRINQKFSKSQSTGVGLCPHAHCVIPPPGCPPIRSQDWSAVSQWGERTGSQASL